MVQSVSGHYLNVLRSITEKKQAVKGYGIRRGVRQGKTVSQMALHTWYGTDRAKNELKKISMNIVTNSSY